MLVNEDDSHIGHMLQGNVMPFAVKHRAHGPQFHSRHEFMSAVFLFLHYPVLAKTLQQI